jgi:amino acid transporter
MADDTLTPENNGFRMGILTAAALCAYTLLAALLGFFSRVEAGAFDIVILVAGVTLAIARYKKDKGNRMPYLQGFGTGIITAIVASVGLGLFFIILTTVMPKSMDLTRARDLFGFDLSVVIAFLAIVLLGSMSGVITSLVAMQAFKSPDHKPMSSIE